MFPGPAQHREKNCQTSGKNIGKHLEKYRETSEKNIGKHPEKHQETSGNYQKSNVGIDVSRFRDREHSRHPHTLSTGEIRFYLNNSERTNVSN